MRSVSASLYSSSLLSQQAFSPLESDWRTRLATASQQRAAFLIRDAADMDLMPSDLQEGCLNVFLREERELICSLS